jgi:hypothetical protein
MMERSMAELNCERFLHALEELPPESPEVLREHLPQQARQHAADCTSCKAALEEFLEVRQAIAPMRATIHEPSPWFVSRVMAVIQATERELQEQAEGVWVSVMRLAPRLAAFAAVLLVFGGTWAMQLHRASHTRQPQLQPSEGLFETAPGPANDDIVALNYEETQP